MTLEAVPAALVGAAVGWAVARLLVEPSLSAAPRSLMRVNVRGVDVPAVLGGALCIGAIVAVEALVLAAVAGWDGAATASVGSATVLVIAVLGLAGYLDDRGGPEAARGFRGHLGALRRGALTGGVVKLVAGLAAGAAAGLLVSEGRGVLETAVLVAGTANLFNLLDRAPGRAAKCWLLAALPLGALGSPLWAVAASGVLGALLACLPDDLAERGMLGDAGANPLGAALGLGLALSLDETARIVAIVVVVGLNLLSERVSFSRVIEDAPWLRALDDLGRRHRRVPK